MSCPAVAGMLAKLEISTDRKVSPRVSVRRTKADAWPNAFGLPAGPEGSCGDVTPFCKGCYAKSVETYIPAVERKMSRNFAALLAAGDDHVRLTDLLDSMLAAWYVKTERAGLPLTFRIHWDGDFYSAAYARAWAAVVRAYPDVTFWVYTRAIWAVPELAGIPNLAVYASVDAWNVDQWADALATYPDIHAAACAESFDAGAALLEKLGRRRAPKCPEGVTMPLVVGPSGRPSDVPAAGEIGQGACNACGLCVHGRADVRFSTTKR